MEKQISAISLKNLTKVFNSASGNVTAIDDLSLDIFEGEIFGIVGLSGAGKSTLVRCLNYLEKPTSGSVSFFGKTLGDLNQKELLLLRREIAMIFQDINLFEQRNVFKNVAFPLELQKQKKADVKNRVSQLLNLVGIPEKENAYPSQLSGGQKQRVAIARALASNPKVLLCDEATSALDSATTLTILNLLKKINSELGLTIVLITHELKVVESICDRVAVVDEGKIAELATVSEFFQNPKSSIAKQLIQFQGGNFA